MTGVYPMALRALLLSLAFCASAAAAPVPTGAPPLRLLRLPPLAPKVFALPRLVAGRDDAAARLVNKALAVADASARDAAADCRAMGKRHSDFSRSVDVTMQGPLYFSVTETRSWYCGGAYPDWSTTPLVYDLATGAAVDLKTLLPRGLIDKTADYNSPGEGLVVSAALTQLYRPGTMSDPQCADVLTHWPDGLAFMLWPDAAGDGIALMPGNLPHVVKACGDIVTVGTERLRQLGVDARLLDAIDEAHGKGWYDKPAPAR